METLHTLGEREVVTRIRKELRRPKTVKTQMEEDAEIFSMKGTLVVNTEMNCAGTHFRNKDPRAIGIRIVTSTITDLLAKGALPKYFFTSIGVSRNNRFKAIRQLYASMDKELKKYNAFLIGGDTTEARDLVICSTAIGTTKKPLLRSGAKTGDKVVLTGEIGNGALGYLMAKNGLKKPKKFLRAQFEPTIDFGLCKKLMKKANAGIDVSDGLAYQLAEVAKQSDKKIVIDEKRLPIDPMLPQFCKENWFKKEEVVFHLGDDYEVVYTMPKEPKLGYTIGEVQKGEGLFIKRLNGKVEPLEGRGWESFSH